MTWRMLLPLLALGCAGSVAPRTVPQVAPSEIVGTLFLIGDAGAPRPDDPVLAALGRMLGEYPDRSSVVFLGDNVYPRGIPDPAAPEYTEAVRRLKYQVDAVANRGAGVFFLAGNHDWDKYGDSGWSAIRRQTELIDELSGGTASMIPGDGCPGPVSRSIPGFRLIALDSQWWLHEGPRPSAPGDGCATFDTVGVAASLTELVAAGDGWETVIVAHHPLESHGEHGGHFPVLDHIFPLRHLKKWAWLPLPIIGSIYPIARRNGYTPQDQSHGLYKDYRAMVEAASGDGVLAYAAGHEHSIQILDQSPFAVEVVSGSGYFGHIDALDFGSDTRFAIAKGGFVRLDRLRDRSVRLSVIIADREETRELHSELLVPVADLR